MDKVRLFVGDSVQVLQGCGSQNPESFETKPGVLGFRV